MAAIACFKQSKSLYFLDYGKINHSKILQIDSDLI